MHFFKNFPKLLMFSFLVFAFAACKKEKDLSPANPSAQNNMKTEAITFNYIIKTNQNVIDGAALKLPAGSFVGIEAATSRGPILLKNFVGEPGNPITFVNMNGKVTIQIPSTYSYGIETRDCKYIKISGKGDPSIKYGIEINGPNLGITFDHLTTDFELENVEVHNVGFAGVMAKTDPSCDSATWRGNFTMRNVSIHDNYVHHTGGEGFYIGNSFYSSGRNLSCGTVYPHEIVNVNVHNNLVEHSGCEGIQVGCAVSGCRIHNNTVRNFGESPFANYQNNGVQIGEGTGGMMYNNLVQDGPGNGIILLGLGDNIVFNNVVKNSGYDGIFCDSRYSPGNAFKMINNTIVNSGRYGVNLYSESIPMNFVINNAILNAKSGYIHTRSSAVKLTAANNYQSEDTITGLKSYQNMLYQPVAGSPLIDAGANVNNYGVNFDFCNKRRPRGTSCDIGAYEFIPLNQ